MTQPPIPEGETLEQAIEKFCSIMGHNNPSTRKAFKQGAEWQKAQAGGEWISVETALPEEGVEVLGHNIDGCIVAFIENGQWMETWNCTNYFVTHWRPLPEPPTPQ